jgi:hypothetical protein
MSVLVCFHNIFCNWNVGNVPNPECDSVCIKELYPNYSLEL